MTPNELMMTNTIENKDQQITELKQKLKRSETVNQCLKIDLDRVIGEAEELRKRNITLYEESEKITDMLERERKNNERSDEIYFDQKSKMGDLQEKIDELESEIEKMLELAAAEEDERQRRIIL